MRLLLSPSVCSVCALSVCALRVLHQSYFPAQSIQPWSFYDIGRTPMSFASAKEVTAFAEAMSSSRAQNLVRIVSNHGLRL